MGGGAGRIRTGDVGFAIRCLSHLATAPNKKVYNPLFGEAVNRLERQNRGVAAFSLNLSNQPISVKCSHFDDCESEAI